MCYHLYLDLVLHIPLIQQFNFYIEIEQFIYPLAHILGASCCSVEFHLPVRDSIRGCSLPILGRRAPGIRNNQWRLEPCSYICRSVSYSHAYSCKCYPRMYAYSWPCIMTQKCILVLPHKYGYLAGIFLCLWFYIIRFL